jgi:hypothetical protein
LCAAELVEVGVKLFRRSAQIDCLAQERALDDEVRVGLADLIGFPA